MSLNKSGYFPRVETTFNTLSVHASLSRSVSTSRNYTSNNISISKEDRRIEEGIALPVRREPYGKRIFKCWSCNEFGHYFSKCLKREKKYKKNFKYKMLEYLE